MIREWNTGTHCPEK